MLVAALALTATALVTQAVAETIVIQGSTTFNRRLMEPYKPAIKSNSKHELTVIPNKSMPGLIALLEGRAHMAMISASLNNEVEQIKYVMPGLAYDRLQAHSIVSTRIAIAMHPSNAVRKASLNQIRKILLGQISNWSELGGKDQPIRVVLVGGGGGVTTVVEIGATQWQIARRAAHHLREDPRSARSGDRTRDRRLGICAACSDEAEGVARIDHRGADRTSPRVS